MADGNQHSTLTALPALCRIKQSNYEDFQLSVPPIGSISAFVGNPTTVEKIYVVTQMGVLTQYVLKPHPPPMPSDMDPNALQLTIEPLVQWDVCRRTKWPELQTPLGILFPEKNSSSSKKNGNTNNDKDKDNSHKKNSKNNHNHSNNNSKNNNSNHNSNNSNNSNSSNSNNNQQIAETSWLSNIEICTHSPQIRPLWASPQFTFKTFQSPNSNNNNINNNILAINNNLGNNNNNNGNINNNNNNNGNRDRESRDNRPNNNNNNAKLYPPVPGTEFYENAPTRKIEVRHNDPIPFRDESLDGSIGSEIYNEVVIAPSAPPVSEDELKENIFKAMSTPMDVGGRQHPKLETMEDYEPPLQRQIFSSSSSTENDPPIKVSERINNNNNNNNNPVLSSPRSPSSPSSPILPNLSGLSSPERDVPHVAKQLEGLHFRKLSADEDSEIEEEEEEQEDQPGYEQDD